MDSDETGGKKGKKASKKIDPGCGLTEQLWFMLVGFKKYHPRKITEAEYQEIAQEMGGHWAEGNNFRRLE